MTNTLLMTSSISVDREMKFHKHIPEKDRLRQYISTVVFYVIKSNFTNIVFADGSGYDLNRLKFLKELASKFEKKIELLSFNNNTKDVISHGKGYGENKIIEYALDNSDIINKSNVFYKVTGRYIVKNINSILKKEENSRNVFFRMSPIKGGTCNTAFFKCGGEEARKFLWGAGDNVYDEKGIYLEHVYFNIIKNNKFKVECFKELPIFHGNAGGSGKNLDLSKPLIYMREFCNRLGLYNI